MPAPGRSLRRFLAVVMKEFKHIWFDPGFFFLTVLSPAVLLMLLSYVFSFDIDSAQLAVINQDNSPESFDYLRELTADGKLEIIATPQNYEEAVELFKRSAVDAVLVIPPDFGRNVAAGLTASVNALADGSDPTVGSQVLRQIESRTSSYSLELIGVRRSPFEVRERVWFNPNLRSQHSMIPGLMAVVLILPAMSVALGITREKETGTFETLVTTPIVGREYLLGKLMVYLSLGLVGTLLALAVATFWFRVPFRGSLALYLLFTSIYLFALMGFCLLVAHIAGNQRSVTSIILLALFIPSFFLTGLTFPVDESSRASWLVGQALPATHFIVISRGITLKALGTGQLWDEALILLGMGLAATLLSVAVFQKRLG